MNKPDIMQKFKQEQFYTIDHEDLDKIISEYIGCTFEFVPTEDVMTDGVHRFVVRGDVTQYNKKAVHDLCGGHMYLYSTLSVLNVMCAEQLLEPGIYLVEAYS